MFVLAIDPGTESSGLVLLHDGVVRVVFDGIKNYLIPSYIREQVEAIGCTVVVEWLSCYGQRVGRETFETCWWAGRFHEAAGDAGERLLRKDVVKHLLGGGATGKGKDAAVRAVLLDRYGPGKAKAMGTKKEPGPLYGVSGHAMQALGVAVTWSEGVRSQL